MNTETKKKLEKAFPAKVIKTRRGPGGKQLSYVGVIEYIGRLNECFGDGWSFEITARVQFDQQVVVEGRIVADGVIKAGLGGAELRRGRDGEVISLGDAFKTASSDCLKRCCRLWGIGLALYEDEEQPSHGHSRTTEPSQIKASIFDSPKAREGRHGRVSRAQLDKLRELVAELGAEWRSFGEWVKSEHGVAVTYASRQLASELIGDLIDKAQARRGNGDASQLGAVQ